MNKNKLIIVLAILCLVVMLALYNQLNKNKRAPKSYQIIEFAGDVDLNLSTTEIHKDSIEELTYIIQTSPEFKKLDRDYFLSVHFVNTKGQILWQDDHPPHIPSSRWEPNKRYVYTRQVYIPREIPSGKVEVFLGLYDRNDKNLKVHFAGKPEGKFKYNVKTLTLVRPQPSIRDDPDYIFYKTGWYDKERGKGSYQSWRWIADKAVASIKNPKKDVILYIQAVVPKEVLKKSPSIEIAINDSPLCLIKPEEQEFSGFYPITKELLGEDERINLTLSTSETFIPASDGVSLDTRKLGIMIYHLVLL